MLIFDQFNRGERPLRWMAAVVGGGLLFLLAGLLRVQILGHRRFEQSLQTQSFQSVRVPALRGRILDRNGRELVGNAPRYRLDVYLEALSRDFGREYGRLRREIIAARGGTNAPSAELWPRLLSKLRREAPRVLIRPEENQLLWRQARYNVVSNVVAQVAAKVGLPLTLTESELHRHWANSRALPMAVLRRLTPQQVALLTEQSWSIHGLSVELQAVRHYPQGALAAHALGYPSGQTTSPTRTGTRSITGCGTTGGPPDSRPPSTPNCGAPRAPGASWSTATDTGWVKPRPPLRFLDATSSRHSTSTSRRRPSRRSRPSAGRNGARWSSSMSGTAMSSPWPAPPPSIPASGSTA